MSNTRKLTLSGILLALAIILPIVTGQIPQIGRLLTPMHFPIIIGSFYLGPLYAVIVGFIAPTLRMILFVTPPYPISLVMGFELATYAIVISFLYPLFLKVKISKLMSVYISLLTAIVVGRIVYAFILTVFFTADSFLKVFYYTFTGSFIGIILQLVLIPILIIRFQKKDN